MQRLLEITYELREIFDDECQLLDAFPQDDIVAVDGEEQPIHGDGITNEQIQAEIQRVTNPPAKASENSSGSARSRWINVSGVEHFDPITNIVRTTSDPAEYRLLANQVARGAKQFRQYLSRI
jgi:hypothetical protein